MKEMQKREAKGEKRGRGKIRAKVDSSETKSGDAAPKPIHQHFPMPFPPPHPFYSYMPPPPFFPAPIAPRSTDTKETDGITDESVNEVYPLAGFLRENECSILKVAGIETIEQLVDADRFVVAKKIHEDCADMWLSKSYLKTNRPVKSIEAQVYMWQMKARRKSCQSPNSKKEENIIGDPVPSAVNDVNKSASTDRSEKKSRRRRPILTKEDKLGAKRQIDFSCSVVPFLATFSDISQDSCSNCWFTHFLVSHFGKSATWLEILKELTMQENQVFESAREYVLENDIFVTANSPSLAFQIEDPSGIVQNFNMDDIIKQFIYTCREIGMYMVQESSLRHTHTIEEKNEKRDKSVELSLIRRSCLTADISLQLKLELQTFFETSAREESSKYLSSNNFAAIDSYAWDFADDLILCVLSNWAPSSLASLRAMEIFDKAVVEEYGFAVVSLIRRFLNSLNIGEEEVSASNFSEYLFRSREDMSWNPPISFENMRSLLPTEDEIVQFLHSQWIFTQHQLSLVKLSSLAFEYQKYFFFKRGCPVAFCECKEIVGYWKYLNTESAFPPGNRLYANWTSIPLKVVENLTLQPGEKYVMSYLESIGVNFVVDLLSTKKSRFINGFVKFCLRNKISSEINYDRASRFLNALTQRFKFAIARQSPVPASIRRLYSGVLAGLPDRAIFFLHDFLKIHDHIDFIEYPTTLMSKKYEDYRKKVGLDVLQGKSAIAGISSWKGIVRDALNCYLTPHKSTSENITTSIESKSNTNVGISPLSIHGDQTTIEKEEFLISSAEIDKETKLSVKNIAEEDILSHTKSPSTENTIAKSHLFSGRDHTEEKVVEIELNDLVQDDVMMKKQEVFNEGEGNAICGAKTSMQLPDTENDIEIDISAQDDNCDNSPTNNFTDNQESLTQQYVNHNTLPAEEKESGVVPIAQSSSVVRNYKNKRKHKSISEDCIGVIKEGTFKKEAKGKDVVELDISVTVKKPEKVLKDIAVSNQKPTFNDQSNSVNGELSSTLTSSNSKQHQVEPEVKPNSLINELKEVNSLRAIAKTDHSSNNNVVESASVLENEPKDSSHETPSRNDLMEIDNSDLPTLGYTKNIKNRKISKDERYKICKADPLKALSDSAREFVIYQSIGNVRDFLSQRTYILAKALVKYREEAGKQKIKFVSAQTTISGWKADVSSLSFTPFLFIAYASFDSPKVRKYCSKDDLLFERQMMDSINKTKSQTKGMKSKKKSVEKDSSHSKQPSKNIVENSTLPPLFWIKRNEDTKLNCLSEVKKSCDILNIEISGKFRFEVHNSSLNTFLLYVGCEVAPFQPCRGRILLGHVLESSGKLNENGTACNSFDLNSKEVFKATCCSKLQVHMNRFFDCSGCFKALSLTGESETFLDISKSEFSRNSVFDFFLTPEATYVSAEKSQAGYDIYLSLDVEYGQVVTHRRYLSEIHKIMIEWTLMFRFLCSCSSKDKDKCLSQLKKDLSDIEDSENDFSEGRVIYLYRLFTLTQMIEIHDDALLSHVKSILFAKYRILHNSEQVVAKDVRKRLSLEIAGFLLYRLSTQFNYCSLDEVSRNCVDEMLLIVSNFLHGRESLSIEADDLLNDLLNCSLTHFNISGKRAELLKVANKVISGGFVEFHDYSVDVLLDFCFNFEVMGEMYDIVDDCEHVRTDHDNLTYCLLMSSKKPDFEALFFENVFPAIMTENWAYIGNRFYYSDNVSNTLPGQLLACVVENYEQGKLPSLPAPYSIKYCLDEWVGTYANDTSASSRNDQLDYAKAVLLANQMLLYFDSILEENILIRSEREQFESMFSSESNPKRPCEVYGPEYFLRMMILLPDLLSMSGIDSDKQTLVQCSCRPILAFLCANVDTIFPIHDAYSPRQYQMEESGLLANRGSNEALVCEADKDLLTDYTFTIMHQVRACIAVKTDIAGKRRGIRLGSAGVQCRWCGDEDNPIITNKFFSVNVDSLAAVPSVLFVHMQRCKSVPSAVKNTLESLKKEHAMKRKLLKRGSQSKFYGRLWERINKLTQQNDSVNVKSFAPTRSVKTKRLQRSGVPSVNGQISFSSYVKVLNHLLKLYFDPKASCSILNDTIANAVKIYYLKCLNSGRAYIECLPIEGVLACPSKDLERSSDTRFGFGDYNEQLKDGSKHQILKNKSCLSCKICPNT